MKLTVLSFSLALTLAVIAGCGIRPGDVDPPPGVEKNSFPKTYPSPATDPAPVRSNP